jgi:energy-coupling factor transporter ATP-binding protein EcfA2
MKIERVRIHNYRSFFDADFSLYDCTLLVGPNNCGKSTALNAIRVFYEDVKYTAGDHPHFGAVDDDAWIELTYLLEEDEHAALAEHYQSPDRLLCIRKLLRGEGVKSNQSNLYAVLPSGELETNLFYGAKTIGAAKLGTIIYVPALTVPADHMKTSGPSPLRDLLALFLKRAVAGSPAYQQLQESFTALNAEACGKDGFLASLAEPLNAAIADWGIAFELSVGAIQPEEIVKGLVRHAFRDGMLGADALPLDRFGHGFQRAVIYELLRLAPRMQTGSAPASKRKEFCPELTLLLFEEPEAFLHPDQQVNMALGLRKLGALAGQQVVLTTHSPVFVGKSSDDLKSIVRISKPAGISELHQLDQTRLDDIFNDGRALWNAMKTYVADTSVPENEKRQAKGMLQASPDPTIAAQEEAFRYQLWLDSDRSGIFFATKVVLCEGPSERVLFRYLLENQWSDLRPERISIIDTLGKYNVHRYMALLDAFGIPHAIIIDGDNGKGEHTAINAMIHHQCGNHALCQPHVFDSDLEAFLGLPKPTGDRGDKKPVAILSALNGNRICPNKLAELKEIFRHLCAVKETCESASAQAA